MLNVISDVSDISDVSMCVCVFLYINEVEKRWKASQHSTVPVWAKLWILHLIINLETPGTWAHSIRGYHSISQNSGLLRPRACWERGYGKGWKLAGKVKGEGERCGERAVCAELGNTWEYEVESLMMLMPTTTIWRRCPRRALSIIEPRQNCFETRWGGGFSVKCHGVGDSSPCQCLAKARGISASRS